MKFLVKHIILFLIQLIERIQYRKKEFDPENPLDKFLDLIPLNGWSVESEEGWSPIEEINYTSPYQLYELLLDNGLKLEVANHHLLFTDHGVKCLSDLENQDQLITTKGLSSIKRIKKTFHKISMLDLAVDNSHRSYFTNNILSHNTISAAIYILWFIIFHNDKGVMIVANKSSTVIEILDKIKGIYKLLPFFLKRGVINWNQKAITLDNGSRIKSENKTKDPAIGFTIDLLYFDEFAKVEDNIIRSYYGTAVPTISSMENSKIIITSTPDGFNLFWELIQGAMKEPDDLEWNGYHFLKVYWDQVKGRKDTKLYLTPENKKKINKYGLRIKDILEKIEGEGYQIYAKKENTQKVYHIAYDEENKIKTHIDQIRKLRVDTIPLLELFTITNWREQQIRLLESETTFRQEYDIEFITGDKTLFDNTEMTNMRENQYEFAPYLIPKFVEKYPISYEALKWVTGQPKLFDIAQANNYYVAAGVDMGEGLKQDYSVINMNRLRMKPFDLIKKDKDKFLSVYDYFQLEQIGLFRSNLFNEVEVAHIFYLIFYELFNPEKCKVVLELNSAGAAFKNALPSVFNSNNEYFGESIFVKYQHNQNSEVKKAGLKVNRNKKTNIRTYQDAVKKSNLISHDEWTLNEVGLFSRHDLPSGDYTYKASTGNDDCIMSVVNLATIFDNIAFKNMVDHYLEFTATPEEKALLEDETNFETVSDYYTSFGKARAQIMNQSRNPFQHRNNYPQLGQMRNWSVGDALDISKRNLPNQ